MQKIQLPSPSIPLRCPKTSPRKGIILLHSLVQLPARESYPRRISRTKVQIESRNTGLLNNRSGRACCATGRQARYVSAFDIGSTDFFQRHVSWRFRDDQDRGGTFNEYTLVTVHSCSACSWASTLFPSFHVVPAFSAVRRRDLLVRGTRMSHVHHESRERCRLVILRGD